MWPMSCQRSGKSLNFKRNSLNFIFKIVKDNFLSFSYGTSSAQIGEIGG